MINFSNLKKIELRRVIDNLIQKSRIFLNKSMINTINITFVPKTKNFGIFFKENYREASYKKYFNIKKVEFISCNDNEKRISNIKNFERKENEIKKKFSKLFKHRNKKKITIASTEADLSLFDSFSMIQKTENLKILILACQENIYCCILLLKMIMDKLNKILKKNLSIFQKIFIYLEFFFLVKFDKNKKMIDKKKIMLFSIKLILRVL